MEVGLASGIITFLDITVKIVARTREFLDQAENAPASLKCIDHRLPLLEKSLQLIHDEILSHRVDDELESKLLIVLKAVGDELERLQSYVTVLSPQCPSSKLQKFNRAIKSVLVYEGKINRALKKLDGYVDTLSFFGNSIVVGRTGRIEQNTESTSQVLATLANDNCVTEGNRERDAILAWLDGIPRDNWVDTCLDRKSAGSSTWIFENRPYLAWLSKDPLEWPSRFLWIHGPAGCGKTFVAATMFDLFESSDIEAAAVFWKSGGVFENASLDEIPRSWITQLLSKRLENYDYIKPIWSSSRLIRASVQEVWKALESILSCTKSSGITLFLDGLEVYQEQQAKRAKSSRPGSHHTLQHTSIRQFLYTLKDALECHQCRFVCFSQPDAEIRSQLSPSQMTIAEMRSSVGAWQHAITVTDLRQEFEELAFEMIQEQLPRKDYDFRLDLARRIAEQAEVHMSIRIMQREIDCLKPTYSEKKLRKMLQQPPDCFHELHQAGLDRIGQLPRDDQRRAWRMLNWVVHALRPLTVQELVEAILVEQETDEYPDEDLPEDLDDEAVYGEIRELCGSLIAFDVGDHHDEPKFWKVRLSHRSLKHFLAQKTCRTQGLPSSSPYTAYRELPSLGSLCVRYLMCKNVWPSIQDLCEGTPQITLPKHPLLAYTATHFHHHLRTCAAEERTEVDTLLNIFLDKHFDKFSTWHRSVHGCDDSVRAGMDSRPLWDWSDHLAFTAAVGLLDKVQQSQLGGGTASSALSQGLCAACWHGSIGMVDALLEGGADMNRVLPNGSSPLHAAALYGQIGVVEHLVQRGADLNLVTGCGTALHRAVEGDHEDVIRILLSRGADATIARCVDGYLPMHTAVQLRRLACVQALASSQPALSRIMNATTTQGWSALGFAVSHTDRETDKEIVRLLLHHGADPLQMYSDGRDPIFICAQQGNYDVFAILGSAALRQAVGNTDYTAGQSLLFAAVMGNSCDIVQVVLGAGVDWNHRDEQGKTALDLDLLRSRRDVTFFIANHIAESHNGIAYLANALTASPPGNQEKLEECMNILQRRCLEQKVTMPEVLVKHLETCPNERHATIERCVKAWAELE
ncbi:hypothetical protein LTR70_009863 [Exophiala xenobiotica]|uniref:Uncharacterized protein n=1 Tax=Lithohypha guttulata TaxID=1690604 RepID=A0ABR0JW81_9EURO|nr:hypothetical protein LTR24_009740 [Lithohypha guttulata]KAK5309930.1 hypothetical protein LTR70_009863 [Exophiala xenobiotica]